jgi:antitoxin MazE
MQLNIAKWGNSLALRLPSHIARESRLEEGAAVNVEVQKDGALIVTPVRKKFKLAELLSKMPERSASGEVDWGKPEGDEAW